MKNFVLSLLEDKLNKGYYFHNTAHTLYVFDKAIEIAQHENCTAAEIELVATAALWHDTGYINVYTGHEEESCVLAKKYLPEYGYSPGETSTICKIIMATKIPQSPQNKLGRIMADADLEYLGTNKAAAISNELFKEKRFLNPLFTTAQWNQVQVSFLEKHIYFTTFCKTNKEEIKQAYLEKIIAGKI